MKITVNLDTLAVITQPSPLRFKGGCFNPVEIAFTRSSASVPLPSEAVIELSIKPKNQWTGGLLAYLNTFTPAAGNLYSGSLNCATAAILTALGLSDQVPSNDLAQVDASAEVTWSFGGEKFRSVTFSATIEAPLTDSNAAATPNPELYPAPSEIALKRDIPSLPVLGTAASLNAGTPNGVATLGMDGKVPAEQLPAMPSGAALKAISVSDSAERLALTPAQVNVGDLVEQTNTHAVYQVIDATQLDQEYGYVQVGERPVPSSDGLVAEWLFALGSELADTSGNAHTLSINNAGPAFGTIDGRRALIIASEGDNAQSGEIVATGPLTITLWARSELSDGYPDALAWSNLSFYCYHGNSGTPAINFDYAGFYGASTPNTGGWIFFSARYDGTLWKYSIGDETFESSSDPAMGINTYQPWTVIFSNGNYAGAVAAVRIWNRALSNDELAQVKASNP